MEMKKQDQVNTTKERKVENEESVALPKVARKKKEKLKKLEPKRNDQKRKNQTTTKLCYLIVAFISIIILCLLGIIMIKATPSIRWVDSSQ